MTSSSDRNRETTIPIGTRNQQTARSGEYFVVAELNRRGAFAVPFAGNMPDIDVLAANSLRTRTVFLQVKTKRSGTWHTTKDKGRKTGPRRSSDHFWVFVELPDKVSSPRYWIVPRDDLLEDIYKGVREYRKRHQGRISPEPPHYGISEKSINHWESRWDLLNLW